MVIAVYSGLTSRLCTIADAVALLREKGGKELTVLWPVVPDCNISSEDVFQDVQCDNIQVSFVNYHTSGKNLKVIDIRKSIWKSIGALFYNVYPIGYNYLFNNEKKMIKKYAKGKKAYDFAPPEEVGWAGPAYMEHKQSVWEAVQRQLETDTDIYIHAYCGIIQDELRKRDLSLFIFKDNYWKTVDSLIGDLPREKLVGIHVRRTDHALCIKMSPLETFITKMDELLKEDKEVRFFLATDDETVQKTLIDRYGVRVIVQDKTWGRNTKKGMGSGIVDFLCLSKCRMVIGSYTSAFSKFSAEYGGIKLIEMEERNIQ